MSSEAHAQWDLFRTFEAVARHGSLTAAAESLGLSQSTVSRHVLRLEEEAGSPLLLRSSPVRLTDRGVALLGALQPMVDAALSARAALESTPELRGRVTVTTVGEVVRWALVHRLSSFYEAYPHLRLRLLANNQTSSLAAGEADIALRMTRPAKGELVARKVTTETYGFYAASSLALHHTIPWLGLAGSLAGIPEQRHAELAFGGRPPRLLVEDVEALGLAVHAGLGVAVLPRHFAARFDDLDEVSPDRVGALDLGPIPPRDLWLVVHRSKQHVPKVRAVMTWLDSVFTTPTEALSHEPAKTGASKRHDAKKETRAPEAEAQRGGARRRKSPGSPISRGTLNTPVDGWPTKGPRSSTRGA